ncbi:unnamed protein product [Trichogramma brassicae]|uniref:Uncharacterized protein n=1 Tax=Trichogramma brassicae TaxID=86971 RepID=A0A6H5IDN5_9HYME|nr:endocuticle structural glycoprotein ABD-5-like [Trichogramma pretiosum]CAB0034646.1 unnamed protein product [Trichogramma brassicae]
MKTIAVFAALMACALAAPQQLQSRGSVKYNDAETYLVRETPSDNIGVDGYQFAYELSDGQTRQEKAEFIAPRNANEEGILRVTGSYSYYNPYDGQTYTVTYVADENGFRPTGAHLPKSVV